MPYGYYLSKDGTKAYPFSREYTALGVEKGIYCKSPDDCGNGRIMLFNDGCKPWKSNKNMKLYLQKKHEVEDNYKVVIWRP